MVEIQDTTIWLVILMIFNYLIVYRKNRFIGVLGYLALGLVMLSLAGGDTTYEIVAFFILFASLINLVYEFVGGKLKMKHS